ncbi:dTMP kinase [Komagataeibacter europaeus]|uniref:dTMP kinase n=1 Tax=Komagataeibacter europaeus TaxID=33995 RepID=UPI0002F7299A|nr:dTMP kinase [Komagataeibacter europaeus]GBQ39089.1 thymidylate kinase [Komagataeibacter europaeus LMG 18890]
MSGLFITFEGGEGAGKSTQARLLADHLRGLGLDVDLTREPGGTKGAEALRDFLLFGGHDLSPRAEVMAHFAARADHVDRRIAPALAAGKVVICDRFTDSTEAYQGHGLGNGDPALLDMIARLRALVPAVPDLTLVLRVPPAIAAARMAERASARTDRYEALDTAFHARVAAGFDAIARRDAARCRRIDASATMDAVQDDIRAVVAPYLKRADNA